MSFSDYFCPFICVLESQMLNYNFCDTDSHDNSNYITGLQKLLLTYSKYDMSL